MGAHDGRRAGLRWFREHDPNHFGLQRAVRVALVATVVLAFTDLILQRPQVVTFGIFGVLALLLFADFPGSRQARAAGYGLLGAIGAVLITVGTLVSMSWWAAAGLMVISGFLVVFAGFLSAATAGGTRAALLTYILPATVPATAADVPDRLLGWAIALALAVPAALFLWPPVEHDRMRLLSSASCRALADRLHLLLGPPPTAPGADLGATGSTAAGAIAARAGGTAAGSGGSAEAAVDPPGVGANDDADPVRAANQELRRVMRSSTSRPVGLTTGSRLLLRLVDEVSWLRILTGRTTARAVQNWPACPREVVAACADVLDAAADLLPVTGRTAQHRDRLVSCLDALSAARARAAEQLAVSLTGDATAVSDLLRAERRAQLIHEWAYACHLLGRTVRDAADADARPLWDRLLGRNATPLAIRTSEAVRLLTVRQAGPHSVALQNGLRAGLGLGLAVLIAQISHVQHGFWIGLGAMSVLRTSAVTTTTTVGKALLGTVAGFAVGGGILYLAGTGPITLWVLLPLSLLVAGYAPATASVAAGQGAFTVAVLILFNILQPVGWTLGLVRVEDVALGCAAALLVGVMMWPRGAARSVRESLASAYRAAADSLVVTVDNALRGTPVHEGMPAVAPASVRLEGALRQYLSEHGNRPLAVHELSLAANGVGRLRLAAEALENLPAQEELEQASPEIAAQIRRRAHDCRDWYDRWAEGLSHADVRVGPPPPADLEHRVVSAVLAAPPDTERPESVRQALQLTWVGLYVDDAALLTRTLAGLSLEAPAGTARDQR